MSPLVCHHLWVWLTAFKNLRVIWFKFILGIWNSYHGFLMTISQSFGWNSVAFKVFIKLFPPIKMASLTPLRIFRITSNYKNLCFLGSKFGETDRNILVSGKREFWWSIQSQMLKPLISLSMPRILRYWFLKFLLKYNCFKS